MESIMRSVSKTILALAILMFPVISYAGNISVRKATSVAESFFIRYGAATRSGSSVQLLNRDDIVMTRSGEEAPYYIFNSTDGGFVIISGIEAAEPVLAYSFENGFSMAADMPENLKSWLEMYREQAEEHRLMGNGVTASEMEKWDRAAGQARAERPKALDLHTPDYGQGDPFNRLCPRDSAGQTVVAGCVTIAAAQIMAYYKYPKHGTGVLPGYSYKGIVIPDLTLGHDYDWDNMLPKYQDVNFTEDQANAVATLVRDVAIMGQVEFNHSSTTGNTNFTFPNMNIYMGYDKSLLRYPGWNMTKEEFKQAILGTLHKGEPVTFSGTSTSGGGHAFVGDGYDEDDRILINWGWNGSSNGYYKLSSFGSYTSGQVAFTDLKPDDGAKRAYTFFLKTGTHNNKEYKGCEYQSGTIAQGSSFTVRFGDVYNYGFTSFTGEFNFAHKDKDGNIKGWLRESPLTLSSLSNKSSTYWINDQTLTVTEPVERGDYVEPMWRTTGGEWQRFANADNDDDNVISKMPMHIRDCTSITYSKSKKAFTLTTMKGVTWTLKKPGGEVIRTAKTTLNDTALNMSGFESGTYTLTLEFGSQNMSLKLTI